MKNIRNTVLSIMDGVVTVSVKHNDDDKKSLTYLALKSDNYQVNDFAVVECDKSYRMVKVVKVDDECDIDIDSNIEYKWMLSRVDMEAHQARLDKVEETVAVFRKKQRQANRLSAKATLLDEAGITGNAGLLSF